MHAPLALDGIRVVSLATNIPGPLAAARCAALGATVTKIEPLRGDALEHAAPQWYRELVTGQRVLQRDLREPHSRAELHALLSDADVLMTTMRASALTRLGLQWTALHARYPQVAHVAIFGERPPHDDRAGHDLTYQAQAGLLAPPAMPRTVLADLAAAERAVAAVFAALFVRERTGEATRSDIGIVECADDFAAPMRFGLTAPHGSLGGGYDRYRLYRAQDGWIALAALEEHFAQRLVDLVGTHDLRASVLERVFSTRPAHAWEAQARALDIPLAAVRE